MSHQTALVIMNAKHELLAHHKRHWTKLPTVDLARERIGFSLSRAVYEQLGLEVFFLLAPEGWQNSLPLLRLQVDSAPLPAGYVWVEPHAINCGAVPQPDLLSLLNLADESPGQYAWYPYAEDWLRRKVSELGHEVRHLEPWNSRSGNVLIRVSTGGPRFWFKAVSDANWREFLIIQALTEHHPLDRPRLHAVEPSWKAMLFENIPGITLAQCTILKDCTKATRMLADVQKKYADHTEAFLRAGATDLRASTLIQKIPGFLGSLESAIRRHPESLPDTSSERSPDNKPPRGMTPSEYRRLLFPPNIPELKELASLLFALCSEVATLPFSDGLFNADFEPRHVLIPADGGLVLVDWAQACVGWPLAAGEYLWRRVSNVSSQHAKWCILLSSAYLRRWGEIVHSTGGYRTAYLTFPFFALTSAIRDWERQPHGVTDDASLLRFGHLLHMTVQHAFENYPVS